MELGDCASWTGAIASVIACIVSIQAATKARRDLKDSSKIQIIQKRLDEVKKNLFRNNRNIGRFKVKRVFIQICYNFGL